MLSVFNAIAPIHRLPVEILSQIFEECWTDRKSLGVGHVCRQWRSVLLNTSGFWAEAVKREKFTLQSDHSTGYLRVLLERSAPRMVAPSFHRFSANISPCLAPHAGRLVSLVVSLAAKSELDALWSCLESGMRVLETLTIALIDSPVWSGTPRTLFENPSLSPNAAPRLTHLTATGCLLHRFAVPSLQHITLKDTRGQYLYYDRFESYESLRGSLEVCASSLETLVLLEVAPPRAYQGAPLSLTALRLLRIRDISRCCTRILSRLVLPRTTYIDCTNTDHGGLCDTVPLDAPAIQLRLRATDYVAVLISAEETGVRCYAGHKELLSVRLVGPRRPDMGADDFVRLLRHARAARVGIGCLDARDSQGVDFRAFSQVARIYIIGREAEEILRNLARRGGGDGDSGELEGPVGPGRLAVCPELRELAVYVGFEFQEEQDGVDPAMMGGEHGSGIAAVFPEWCGQLEGVLSRRAEMGTRLTGLQLGWTESKRSAKVDSVVERLWTLPPRTSDAWGPWGAILGPLERLVDGPVVVHGYRAFGGDGRWLDDCSY